MEEDFTYIGGISPGYYKLVGKERCDSSYLYDAPIIEIELFTDGILTGTTYFTSANERNEYSPIHGTWEEDGTIKYFLSYFNTWYYYEGKWKGKGIVGFFGEKTKNSYNETPINRRGGFSHSVKKYIKPLI